MTNEILKKLIAVEVNVIEGLGFEDIEEWYKFLYRRPDWQEQVDSGLIILKSYETHSGSHIGRFELTILGQAALSNVPAIQKIAVLIQQHLRILVNIPSLGIVKLCRKYIQQLSLEELPVLLSSNHALVREYALKHFEELKEK